ncbi:site-2 protease family protein [Candidatus Dojkabacteria bacterium HGW-Dojkabacteria-1]|uniref:Site-2 protease family protein n=1 Tax=Candidatus Dojkabacteria bacterium HGW-Dojkabacteria-1 TaxID=2013761 RepID=A0A2N2F4I6_9BACT|nr:MAG: site-2 protease family protein [Candidatus Dojkabacteria bacterium HGW-Dojkabacteria-1]
MILSKRFLFIKLIMTETSLIQEYIYWILVAIPSILVAATVHEYAHAYTAFRLGDATAKAEGRLTLNPLKHIDPIGAIFMILFRFGWSKPVPINEYNFEKRELYTAIVAFAGPLSNLLLAFITGLVFRILPEDTHFLIVFLLYSFATINIALAVFNLIPIPPLDGHKIVRALLPAKLRYYWEYLERYAIFLILLLILPFSPLSKIVFPFIGRTLTAILTLLGF